MYIVIKCKGKNQKVSKMPAPWKRFDLGYQVLTDLDPKIKINNQGDVQMQFRPGTTYYLLIPF